MLSLIKTIFAIPWRILTWIRQTIANLIVLFLILIILSVWLAQDSGHPEISSGALVIAPSGAIVEQRTYVDPFVYLLNEEEQRDQETLLYDITLSIEAAADDTDITALVIDTTWLQAADPSKLFSVGAAIERFKESGKPVVAVGDSFTQGQYLLASYADTIYLNPMGTVFLHGFGAYPNFYKDAIDKLKINVHVFRAGEYKSFIEPFIRNDMSDEAKQNTQRWLNDIWLQVTDTLEQQRELPAGTVNDYINNFDSKLASTTGDAAQLALNSGFVDIIANRSEVEQQLIALVGEDPNSGSFAAVSLRAYARQLANDRAFQHGVRDKVGVIVASGAILDGEQPAGNIGGDTLAAHIRKAREDHHVKALVLRIDSPGGSAFASEVIRNELAITQAEGIPVITSFGGIAASGGYWIASTSDEIWSTPATITGSIGVFGMVPTFEDSFSALGIHSDGVGTTDLAGAWHLNRAMTPVVKNTIQLQIDHTYDEFLNHVASGRQSSKQAIHEVAQGKVWSGQTAKELGLVDGLGDLDAAIASAASLAGLGADYHWEFVKKDLSPREQFMQQLTSQSLAWIPEPAKQQPDIIERSLRRLQQELAFFSTYNDPQGVYLRCLECQIR